MRKVAARVNPELIRILLRLTDADSTDLTLADGYMEPLDDLEAVLDRILDDRPELDAVVGDWDLLLRVEEHVRGMHTHVVSLTKSWRPPEPAFYPYWKFRLRARCKL